MTLPELGPKIPRRGNRISRAMGRFILTLMGWRIVGNFPNEPKIMAIAAPHTSNWDFVIGIAALMALGIRGNWLGKHTLFKKPFGGMMRWLGGMPVNRSVSAGLVEQTTNLYNAHDQLFLGIAPEGTRKKVDRWKTGFYRIALAAGVPLVCAFFDYARKEVGIDHMIIPSGNLEADLADIMSFYAKITPRHPDQF